MEDRFAEVSNEEIDDLIEGKKSKATLRSEACWIKVFSEWMIARKYEDTWSKSMTVERLAELLIKFIPSARKKDHSEYSHYSLKTGVSSIIQGFGRIHDKNF